MTQQLPNQDLSGRGLGEEALTPVVPPLDLQLLPPIGWTNWKLVGKGAQMIQLVEVLQGQGHSGGMKTESDGESGHPALALYRPRTALPNWHYCYSFTHSTVVAWKLKKHLFLYFIIPIYIFLYNIHVLEILPFLQVIFQVLETKSSIHQPPKEELHRETLVFKLFFRYWILRLMYLYMKWFTHFKSEVPWISSMSSSLSWTKSTSQCSLNNE